MRLLDLFCGGGGAAMGYHRAGFDDIVGVDIAPQPRYPFTFVQADALTYPLDGFDAIHASPPCQEYSITRTLKTRSYLAVVEQVRERLMAHGTPWILENVVGAPMAQGVLICGTALGLNVRRHRLFDSSHYLWSPGPCRHTRDNINCVGHSAWNYHPLAAQYTHWRRNSKQQSPVPIAAAREAFEVPWMRQCDIAECIPPAYTAWLGCQLLAALAESEERYAAV